MDRIRKRARSQQQKDLRRTAILDAAEQRFRQAAFEDITLTGIAADNNLSKAALYRYFRTKDALFIGLFDRAFEQLLHSAATTPVTTPADTITDVLLANPLYCRLSAIMNTVLEKNLHEDEAVQFKRNSMKRLTQLVEIVEQREILAPGTAFEALLMVQQALVGCWHMTRRSPVLEQIVQRPEFRPLSIDFETALRQHISRLI